MADTFLNFPAFFEALAEKKHNLATDTLKMCLTTGPVPTGATGFTDLSEIADGSGYPAGGAVMPVTASRLNGSQYELIVGGATIAASGGAIGPYRGIVIYNATATGAPLIAYVQMAADSTISDGGSLTVAEDQAIVILRQEA
jgi:hypothetical protein